jgi:4-amino-4-deoxy-L-arabinose transferase-like glycosyltransferase
MQMLENWRIFLTKHANIVNILTLGLFCALFLFYGLGAYPLIDVDETRYVFIAKYMYATKNLITPVLNEVPFLEKPPLYFWLTAASYKLFGDMSEFFSRLPTALFATFAVFFTYFFGKKALGPSFGFISALILLTNIWFLIFSHIAILDMGFMALTMASIYSVLLTLFCKKESSKKYCWWAGYFFMALAVLMKGLIGVAIPMMVVFFSLIATRRFKEIFRVQNWFLGLIIFILVAAPWHYFVWLKNGHLWVQEYLIKHHFARFTDSGLGLGRKQPFLFYVPILLGGFMPWTISLLAAFANGVKTIFKNKNFKLSELFSTDTNEKKMLVTMCIYFFTTFLFFSISSSKLPTYILVVFPALSLLCGYFWWGYISYGKFTKWIVISTVLTSLAFLALGFGGLVIGNLGTGYLASVPALPAKLQIAVSMWFIAISAFTILCTFSKKRALLFISNVALMFGVIFLATMKLFGFLTTFGQDELEKYAQKAQKASNSVLITFDFAEKYSVLHHFSGKIIFIHGENFEKLQNVENTASSKHQAVYVIVRNKHFQDYSEKFDKYTKIDTGKKYSLFVKEPRHFERPSEPKATQDELIREF